MKQRIEKKSMKPKADSWKRIRTYLDWPRGKNKQQVMLVSIVLVTYIVLFSSHWGDLPGVKKE